MPVTFETLSNDKTEREIFTIAKDNQGEFMDESVIEDKGYKDNLDKSSLELSDKPSLFKVRPITHSEMTSLKRRMISEGTSEHGVYSAVAGNDWLSRKIFNTCVKEIRNMAGYEKLPKEFWKQIPEAIIYDVADSVLRLSDTVGNLQLLSEEKKS